MNRVIFKSMSDDWRTPVSIYKSLHAEFGFRFDPCPIGSRKDNLKELWEFPAFCNPPYSDLKRWVRKAWIESHWGTVVMLIPSRTDTIYWHTYVMKAKEIRFLKGRLKFTRADGSISGRATFPSCVVVF